MREKERERGRERERKRERERAVWRVTKFDLNTAGWGVGAERERGTERFEE